MSYIYIDESGDWQFACFPCTTKGLPIDNLYFAASFSFSSKVGPLKSNIEAALIAAGARGSAGGAVQVAVDQRGALDGMRNDELWSIARLIAPAGAAAAAVPMPPRTDPPASCPLITRLADCSVVEVEERHLLPLLQRQLDAATTAALTTRRDGGNVAASVCGGGGKSVPYDAAVVLCAGAFGNLVVQQTPLLPSTPPTTTTPTIPVISPFEAAAAVVRARKDVAAAGATLFVPSDAQQPFALARWRGGGGVAGFKRPGMLSAATIEHDGVTEAQQIIQHLRRGTYGPTGTESAIILDFVGHRPALAEELRERLPGRMVLDVGEVSIKQLAKAIV